MVENGRGGDAEAEADVVVGGAGAVGVAGATDVDAVAGASAGIVPVAVIGETCGGVGDSGIGVAVEPDSDELFLTDTTGERSRPQLPAECTETVGDE